MKPYSTRWREAERAANRPSYLSVIGEAPDRGPYTLTDQDTPSTLRARDDVLERLIQFRVYNGFPCLKEAEAEIVRLRAENAELKAEKVKP